MHLVSFTLCITVVLGLAIPESHPHNSFSNLAGRRRSLWHRDVTQRLHHAPPALVARTDPASDELWNKATCKGGTLMKAMMLTDKEAAKLYDPVSESAQSQFEKFEDLKAWGYGVAEYDDYYDFDVSLPIKVALEGLGISMKKHTEGGQMYAFMWEHEIETEHDKKKYPPTHASYTTLFNPSQGVMIGWGAFSPAYMGPKQNPPITTVPALKTWSDISYLQWSHLPSPAPINYIIKSPCENSDTQAIVARALKNTGGALKTWPGTTFSMTSDEGKAILGSPNGFGAGYLLVQHKSQLGNRIVEKVQVWMDDGKKQPRPPSILFYVKAQEPQDD